jgi:hypothetical protein
MASVLMHDFPPCNPSWEIPVFEIEGRHILVTGGSGGLGQHFARFLANNGANVTLAARRPEALTLPRSTDRAARRRAWSSTSLWRWRRSECYSTINKGGPVMFLAVNRFRVAKGVRSRFRAGLVVARQSSR